MKSIGKDQVKDLADVVADTMALIFQTSRAVLSFTVIASYEMKDEGVTPFEEE